MNTTTAGDTAHLRIFVQLEPLAGGKPGAAPAPVAGSLTTQRWLGQPFAREVSIDALGESHVLTLHDLPAQAGAPTGVGSGWFGEQVVPGALLAVPGARALLCVRMNVIPQYEEEFNDWYSKEHVPAISRVPGVIAARRFRSATGSPPYVALYHLAELGVSQSRPWMAAAETPWTHRLRPHTRERERYLFHRQVA